MSSTDVRQTVSPVPVPEPDPATASIRRMPPAPPLRAARPGRRSGRGLTIAVGAALAVGALITAFPFVWMLFSSVKPQSESIDYPPRLLPQP